MQHNAHVDRRYRMNNFAILLSQTRPQRLIRRFVFFVLCGLFLPGFFCANVRAQKENHDPYLILRNAYLSHDAELAASAYKDDARYIELYDGTAPILRFGKAQIQAGFAEVFKQFSDNDTPRPIDLNFRILPKSADFPAYIDRGFYRLRVGNGNTLESYFGRFSAELKDGLFAVDASTNADVDEFERSSGPLRFAADDETLDAKFYNQLLGHYRDANSCIQTVTRSAWRIFVLDECDSRWYGLTRLDGLNWTSGAKIVNTDAEPTMTFSFNLNNQSLSSSPVSNAEKTSIQIEPTRISKRVEFYRTESIRFGSEQQLAGQLWIPTSAKTKMPGVVVVHGSGEQDRFGYASIIGIIAQQLARSGAVVLSYDKRGVGESSGDWSSAGFDQLASDAKEAMQVLRTRIDVDVAKVGLAGSSQAGWVVAKAIEADAKPAFTILLGAAGSALSVREQNLYNTRVQMQCAGIRTKLIELALHQQNTFFDAKRNALKLPALHAASKEASRYSELSDWLFPNSIDPTAEPQWYDVLDLDFDPKPIWKNYQGDALFLFGELDDSTPTTLAIRLLKSLNNPTRLNIVSLKATQHLGLSATSLCKSGLADLSHLNPETLSTISRFIKRRL